MNAVRMLRDDDPAYGVCSECKETDACSCDTPWPEDVRWGAVTALNVVCALNDPDREVRGFYVRMHWSEAAPEAWQHMTRLVAGPFTLARSALRWASELGAAVGVKPNVTECSCCND